MAKERSGKNSALNVQKGVDRPDSMNPEAARHVGKIQRGVLSVKEYVSGIRKGNRSILGRAITLVESALPAHQNIAQEVIEACLPHAGRSIRIGITGVPGVGKSTFIESLGTFLTQSDHKLAVLAIDPSSEKTRGSILGDKTRMEKLSSDPKAFIRPSPSAGSLGGVARKTKESIILCEAAGFDTIIVETVGVGQSETAVHAMVDFFLLLMLAGAGDELQGIKKGIMEMADALVINKTDGDNVHKAEQAKQEYQNALHLFPPSESGWVPVVKTCSSINNSGIPEVWKEVMKYKEKAHTNGFFQKRRKDQEIRIFYESIGDRLKADFFSNPRVNEKLNSLKNHILHNEVSAYQAGQELLKTYYESLKHDSDTTPG